MIHLHFHYRDKLSKKQLARKLNLCREVLKVTEIVETGIATKIGTYIKEKKKENKRMLPFLNLF